MQIRKFYRVSFITNTLVNSFAQKLELIMNMLQIYLEDQLGKVIQTTIVYIKSLRISERIIINNKKNNSNKKIQ